jgi:hypothetical protein
MDNSMQQRVLLVLGLVPAFAVCVVAFRSVPQFQEVFTSFGAELPWQTSILVSWYRASVVIPALVFVTWLTWPSTRYRGVAALLLGASVSFLALLFGWWAAYGPIFALPTQP